MTPSELLHCSGLSLAHDDGVALKLRLAKDSEAWDWLSVYKLVGWAIKSGLHPDVGPRELDCPGFIT